MPVHNETAFLTRCVISVSDAIIAIASICFPHIKYITELKTIRKQGSVLVIL